MARPVLVQWPTALLGARSVDESDAPTPTHGREGGPTVAVCVTSGLEGGSPGPGESREFASSATVMAFRLECRLVGQITQCM